MKLELFLISRDILNPENFKQALEILNSILNPDHILPDPTPEFRKLLAMALFYKVSMRTLEKSCA